MDAINPNGIHVIADFLHFFLGWGGDDKKESGGVATTLPEGFTPRAGNGLPYKDIISKGEDSFIQNCRKPIENEF